MQETYGFLAVPSLIKMEKKISKTKIEKRMKVKTNAELVETIIKIKKKNPSVAKMLAGPKRNQAGVNLDKINSINGDVLVIGKILSSGNLDKSKKIVGWNASEKAKEKIKSVKGEFVLISDEIKKNPGLKDLEVLK
jgi:ribosomal protein L18E